MHAQSRSLPAHICASVNVESIQRLLTVDLARANVKEAVLTALAITFAEAGVSPIKSAQFGPLLTKFVLQLALPASALVLGSASIKVLASWPVLW